MAYWYIFIVFLFSENHEVKKRYEGQTLKPGKREMYFIVYVVVKKLNTFGCVRSSERA